MGSSIFTFALSNTFPLLNMPMKKAMKSMKAMKSSKAITKGSMVKDIATEHGLKNNGIFTIPGLCRIKTKTKKATKAGKRMMFGQEVKVKAKPARTVVKAFAVAALKNQI